MKYGILSKLLAAVQIAIAIAYFDLNSWNQIWISLLLFLGGINLLLIETESPTLGKGRKIVTYVTFLAALALIIKLVVIG